MKLELDKHEMYQDLKNYSKQIEDTLAKLKEFSIEKSEIEKIVFCGMGGSAIGGDIVRACFFEEISIPMMINRDYKLPKFVDSKTLVIVCSFSGNTEETLSCFDDARTKNAEILAISSGGELEKKCEENEIPFFKLNYKSSCGQPRVNSGVMLTAVVGILEKLGLINVDAEIWQNIINRIDINSADWGTESEEENLAIDISQDLKDKIPVFHGAGFLSAVVRRLKQDVNETAKQSAFYEEIPESNHNAVVGYEFPEANKQLIMVGFNSSFDNPSNAYRLEILEEIWEKAELEWINIETVGDTKLEQVFHLVQLSMFVSFYLGISNNIDPTPVNIIDFLKTKLAEKIIK